MRNILVIFALAFLFGQPQRINAQVKRDTETDKYIFWQADRLLTPEDFRGTGSRFTKHNQYCDQYNMCTMAFLGLFTALDVPKKNKDKLIEKAYFVPLFETFSSYILKKDTAGVKEQQVIFDIYELSARFARKSIKQYHDSIPKYGTISIMFKTIEMDAADFRNTLIKDYTTELYINKKADAFKIWRSKINLLLLESNSYATSANDCYRAIKKAAIDPKYITARNYMPDLKAKKRAHK